MLNNQPNAKLSLKVHRSFRETIPSWLLLVGLVLVGAFFAVMNPRVFSSYSISSILATASMQGIVALSLLFVMTTGTFDLAAGMKAAIAAAIVGYMCADGFTVQTYILAIIVGIAVSTFTGFIHGILSVTLRIPGFIAALALRLILQAVIAVFTKNSKFYSTEWGEGYKVLGRGSLGDFLPYPFLIFLGLCLLCWILMERTRMGRQIYSTGANKTAAEQAGIKTNKARYMSFIIGGAIAAIGGILYTSRNYYIDVDMGLNLQMPAMTCVLLGATFFQPGKYNVPGCLVGALFTSLLMTGIPSVFTSGPWLNYLVQGVAFLLSLGLIARTKSGGLSKVTFDM